MESKRQKQLTQNLDKSENQQNNVTVHESFNEFTSNVLFRTLSDRLG